ncbi:MULTISPECIES: hypothetical protein [Megasphaera]|uniref:hypothetical protein n=1 Tax=Megasphaera TaxID=906 RepID=UPI00242C878F|nr:MULTISPECIES: hypothetical protein [Megasphaera]MCF0151725.1 hypothetical protein [Megasphaera sp.]MCI7599600.1 hypothetical protein [Megasphaera sp.]MEE0404490.1 hypothetical protein [Megasphaera elsdenii]
MKNKGSSILEEKKDQAKKLKVIAAPLVEYIRKNQTPMTTVIVTGAGVEVLSTEISIPLGGDWD